MDLFHCSYLKKSCNMLPAWFPLPWDCQLDATLDARLTVLFFFTCKHYYLWHFYLVESCTCSQCCLSLYLEMECWTSYHYFCKCCWYSFFVLQAVLSICHGSNVLQHHQNAEFPTAVNLVSLRIYFLTCRSTYYVVCKHYCFCPLNC